MGMEMEHVQLIILPLALRVMEPKDDKPLEENAMEGNQSN